jgi:hypothetical protein
VCSTARVDPLPDVVNEFPRNAAHCAADAGLASVGHNRPESKPQPEVIMPREARRTSGWNALERT